jgi:DNA ligase-1
MSFNVMLAKEYDPKRINNWENIYVEPKLDGVRVLVFVTPKGNVRYYSRNGRELDMFGHLDSELSEFAECIRYQWESTETVMFDGEMTGTDFGDIAGAIHRKNATVETTSFNMFLAVPHSSFKKGADTLTQGLRVKQMFDAGLRIPTARQAKNDSDVRKLYQRFLNVGHEGAMVKDYSKPWTAGRSFVWMKMKEENSVDLRIVGFKEGAGKYKGTLGALICDYKGKKVPVSGMSDEQRDYIWANQTMYEGAVCEVLYQLVTVHGSLRHPRFKRMRGLHGEKL